MKRQFTFVTLLLLAGIMVTACGATPQPQVVKETVVVTEKETVEVVKLVNQEVPVEVTSIVEKEVTAVPPQAEPATLTIGVKKLFTTLNPLLVGGGWPMRYLVFDRIGDIDSVTSIRPGLAESWEPNEDHSVWTFKIREGVTFHDGTPCTADEIAWSINWMIENQFPAVSAYVGGFREAVALDPTTLQLTLDAPVREIVATKLTFLWILPPSVWKDLTAEEANAKEDLETMIGNGPYMVADYAQDEYVVFEAYDGYWRGRAPVDRVVFKKYATDEAAVQALLAGEIDVLSEVPWHAIDTLQKNNDVKVVTLPMLWTHYLMINSLEGGTQPESLKDPVVRLAIAHAIDKQKIVDLVYLGYGQTGTIPTDPDFGDLHNPNIEDIPFDVEEGNRILEEAGYLDSDGDGIREWKDGTPLEYRLYTDEGATGVRKLEIISEGLAQIGISTTPQELDSMMTLYPDYDFDLAIWGWKWDPDVEESLRSYTCAQAPDGWNDCGLCDAEYDELYAQQSDPMLTDQERQDIIWQMQEIFFESRCYITLAHPPSVSAYRTEGFTHWNTTDYSTLWFPKGLLQLQPVR